jgi:predicted membrane-bound spermidine synthase
MHPASPQPASDSSRPPPATEAAPAAEKKLFRLARISVALLLVMEVVARAIGLRGPFALAAVHLVSNPDLFHGSALAAFLPLLLDARGGPRARPAVLLLAAGAALAVPWHMLAGGSGGIVGLASRMGVVVGTASLAWLLVALRRRDRAERGPLWVALAKGSVLLSFVTASHFLLELTVILRPEVLDHQLYRLEQRFGFQPSFLLGAWLRQLPLLATLAISVYSLVPLFAGLFLVRRASPVAGDDLRLIQAFVWISLIAYGCYFLFPVIGPVHALSGFPGAPPPVDSLAERLIGRPVWRNCVPSLHTAWALLFLVWAGRSGRRPVQLAGGAILVLTLLATLGFGYHYLVDLIASVPLVVGVLSFLLPDPRGPSGRLQPQVGFSALLFTFWLILIRHGETLAAVAGAAFGTALLWLAAIGTVVWGAWALRPLAAGRPGPLLAESPPETTAPASTRPLLATLALFFVSGASALMYEVVFGKWLALVFGSTATATKTVLVTYMGGMALGAWIGGRRGRQRPLRTYGLLELGIAAWCLISPVVMQLLKSAYLQIGSGLPPGSGWLTVWQMLMGAVILLPPTVLMGMTMPAVAALVDSRQVVFGRGIGLLYASNTLGAALGALVTGYAIVAAIGLRSTIWLAVGANLLVGLLGLHADRKLGAAPAAAPPAAAPEAPIAGQADGAPAALPLLLLTVGGAITLALEVVYIHLLAVVAGNSTYAFSLMLFCFLVGLGGGAALGRVILARTHTRLLSVALLECVLAAVIVGGIFVWDELPAYFASYGQYAAARDFASRELVRFVVCAVAMVPPALVIGALYPILVDLFGGAWKKGRVHAVGVASAANTAGNIAGVLLAGFLLLPALGSLTSLRVLAVTAIGLALLCVRWCRGADCLRLLATAGLAGLLVLVVPRSFDQTRLASGANVYFSTQPYGDVIDHAESLDGGLTSVAVSTSRSGQPVHTLLTNGKFQGDDGAEREVAAQLAFGLYPVAHTAARGRALVIGFGVGGTARGLWEAGFQRLDIAELSADVLAMADRYFQRANRGVLHKDNVSVHVTDGRNFLMLSPQRYDLISMEVSSIWFAGASSLYNREFYQLAASRLSEQGVFQQWVQLHRISPLDIGSVLATVRQVFPQVWLYFPAGQGVIVACRHDCRPTPQTLAALTSNDITRQNLRGFGGHEKMLERILLDPAGTDRLLANLARAGLPPEDLVSTDDNMQLEFSTPKGNVRPYAESLRSNLEFLRRASAP